MSFNYFTSFRTIEVTDFLKALGICLVVLNHSSWHNLEGGLNILILISGLNFARFSLKKDNTELALDIARLLKKLLIPSLLLMGFYSLLFNKFDWKEILLISNFFYTQKIAAFPVWYVQVITQLMLVIALIAFVFNFAKWTRISLLGFSLVMLFFSILIPPFIDQYLSSAELFWKLPHYIAWNFILGWVVWASIEDENQSPLKLCICWLLIVISAFIVFQLYQEISINRFLIFSSFATVLLLFKKIQVPTIFYRPIVILASAVFYIFLLHGGIMYFIQILMIDHFSYATVAVCKFFISISLCCVLFILVTATLNALKTVRESSSKVSNNS
ncbi:MAG: acyltransferase family protein [Paraglaciecola sp.]|uniref:acyltransferase family protein n=1 Tax=Paraglaciecola sp. TaxID=1920173 RepID=UPI003299DCDD